MNEHVQWYTAWVTYDCGHTKEVNQFYGIIGTYGEETDLYKVSSQLCWECSKIYGAEQVRLA